jgi:threonylcarbamoyladenosine tRNA methylthiotransferase MtaB
MRVKLKTLGCRLNEAELETWAQQFQTYGHYIVSNSQEADLVVLNSCAVTQDAARKSRHLIRRMHRESPQAKLIVSGCYATLNAEEAQNILGVDLVVGNADKARLVEIAQKELDLPTMPTLATEPGEVSLFSLGRQRAFIKVQDGCRYRCTFCIVTVARGEEKSRPACEVVEEINTLHRQGIEEFVLTGVHLGGWGSDLGMRLEDLIKAILDQTEIPRLRLGSLEPWELSEDFFMLLQNPRVMPHLHLPLQNGSDAILRRMARRCKTAEFDGLVNKARAANPDVNITTDIIVGFPGEIEELWEESLAFIKTQGFGHIHIFSYSLREGTKAAGLPGQIPDAVKKARTRQLHQFAEEQKRAVLSRFIGRELPVLWERGEPAGENGKLRFPGYTPNYLRVETLTEMGTDISKHIAVARLIALAETGDHLLGELVD